MGVCASLLMKNRMKSLDLSQRVHGEEDHLLQGHTADDQGRIWDLDDLDLKKVGGRSYVDERKDPC